MQAIERGKSKKTVSFKNKRNDPPPRIRQGERIKNPLSAAMKLRHGGDSLSYSDLFLLFPARMPELHISLRSEEEI